MSTASDGHRRRVEAFNRGDSAGVVELYGEDVVVHDPLYPEPLRGRAAVRQDYAGLFTAFPDARVTTRSFIERDDMIAIEITITGTHTGPIATPDGDLGPTGRSIELPMGVFARVDAVGALRGVRRYYDVATLFGQLGLG